MTSSEARDRADEQEFEHFLKDLRVTRFKGSNFAAGPFTAEEMGQRLEALLQRRNKYVLEWVTAFQQARGTGGWGHFIWEYGATHFMANVATPSQTGPAGTDEYGLWKEADAHRLPAPLSKRKGH